MANRMNKITLDCTIEVTWYMKTTKGGILANKKILEKNACGLVLNNKENIVAFDEKIGEFRVDGDVHSIGGKFW
ncbi:10169_t:CDS:2 [Racocetra persica]|uniref:10169_t:CDS:1 n=1 Tax=Racocetra persica TaxID=160502 RepID=A0ACA9KQE5_9GLOM|nr:10169_t:CDS:2 [Racocetra persica]